MKRLFYIAISFLLLTLSLESTAQVAVVRLRCDGLDNPVAIDNTTPSFSWEMTSQERNVVQKSYQILVASTIEKLYKNEGDYWRASIVGDRSNYIPYHGKPLYAGQKLYWKVKIVTSKGETNWSDAASFGIGLLRKEDWKAKWIGLDKASSWDSISQWSRLSARYLRKRFKTSSAPIKRATVYISGLGLYELYCNGKKVGNQVLAPAPTDYRKTVLYNAYDVTNLLQKDDNAIGVILGNGRFFTMRQNYKPQKINNFGFPKMLFQLEVEYTNGKKDYVVSDGSWKLNVDGAIRSANEYDGEEYDATKEWKDWTTIHFDDTQWQNAQLVQSPTRQVKPQMTEAMHVMQTLKPVRMTAIPGGKWMVDFGQNFAGWMQLKVRNSKRGQRITMRFAESLQKDGSLYAENLRDAKSTDVYIANGEKEEVWHPRFVYHGFRFVEISGLTETPMLPDFEGQLIYDNMQNAGTVTTSNGILNEIIHNAWWSIASNYKGMPVDCPQRNERQPWLGDRTIGSYGESFLFGNYNLYRKWMDDMMDAQTVRGAIPDVAPAFWNYYSDDVSWPATYLFVANMLYRQYGDVDVIRRHYASMRKWVLYMDSAYVRNNLIARDKYGDWCVPPEDIHAIKARDTSLNTNGTLIASAYYYQALQYMKLFARLTQHETDILYFDNLSSKIKQAFNQRFLKKKEGCYDNNTTTANLLPLSFDMVPDSLREEVFNNIYKKIRIDNKMHINTGVIGTQWLMRGLNSFGRSDIAYRLATNTTYPSWGYMVENGATTIWELWNGNTASPKMNSQNHVMLLGDLLIWLYENVAGIKSDSVATGFKKIMMKPEIIDGLDSMDARYLSQYGEIVSRWKKTLNDFQWKIIVPPNSSAKVYIPAYAFQYVQESGKALQDIEGIRMIAMENGYAVLEIGSGKYEFLSRFPFRKGIVKSEFIFKEADFPESHCASIAETPKGLMATWFGGTKEGNKDVCIYTSKNENGRWSQPVKVADGIQNDSFRIACYNPVLYQVPHGDLLLFYKIGENVAAWKGWMKRSSDNGATWGQPEALPDGYLGPIKNKPVLVNGVLLCPSSTEKNGWKVHFEYTKDWGRTWNKSSDMNDGKTITAIQPSILSYANGRLQILCRSQDRSINESWSADGGYTWSSMQQTSLPNNNSGTDAVTLSNGWQLLVYNHVKPNATLPKGKGARTPLNVAVSKDGKTWYAAFVLEDSPINQYSYPSVIQSSDGKVHIVYTWRRERIKHVELDPTQLELHEIKNGVWPVLK
ncbi:MULTISPECIES: family 78 glycoside hydrolase catalytic domain [Chitinophagaceae]